MLLQGGPPPCTPRRSAGGRPIGQEIMQNQWGQFCENQLSIAKFKKKKEIFWNFSATEAVPPLPHTAMIQQYYQIQKKITKEMKKSCNCLYATPSAMPRPLPAPVTPPWYALALGIIHKGRLLKGVGRWVHQKEIY